MKAPTPLVNAASTRNTQIRTTEFNPLRGLFRSIRLRLNGISKTRTQSRTFGPQPTEENTTHAFRAGDLINDRYRIEALIGRGGMGEVFRAYDLHRRMPIALKTVRRNRVDTASEVEALRNELNTASKISHPNICRLFDISICPAGKGASFITMELLTGEPLAARVQSKPFDEAEAYPIVLQLVNGIAAAHDCGVIHRDLKPTNIFLIPLPTSVRAVIADFGLAMEISSESTLSETISQGIAGTPAYMAPEQLRGMRPSRAFDIHALGSRCSRWSPAGCHSNVKALTKSPSQDSRAMRQVRQFINPTWTGDGSIASCAALREIPPNVLHRRSRSYLFSKSQPLANGHAERPWQL